MAKLFLSRMPISYRLFAQIGVFRHGHMDDADYAYGVFMKHAAFREERGAWVGAEIGPGDSVFSAVLAHAYGAASYWLVDSGSYADRSPKKYSRMTASLIQQGLLTGAAGITEADDFATLLNRCCARYLTDGVDSLGEIPDSSVDFVWSNAVLEHIRVAQFRDFCEHMYRILRPGGCASHQVDFKDHLSAGLNNLRFSQDMWERDWFAARSGFYTNRIRPKAMIKTFEDVGFKVQIINESRWEHPPISSSQLPPEFRGLDESDFLISGAHFVLTKPDVALPKNNE